MPACGFKCVAKFALAVALQVIVLPTWCKRRLHMPLVLHYEEVHFLCPLSLSQAADWKEKMGMPQPSVYSKVPLPEACLTRYRTIYVSHVTSPGDFYVQLIGTETSQALEGLQQDMTNFYSSQQGQSYTVEDVYPGFVSGKGWMLM